MEIEKKKKSGSSRFRMLPYIIIVLFAFLVRVLVSLHSYSGEGNPPMYGDFEAQRHWMEITINTPPRDWYRNSTANDLSYWGLDYPPLTAYQSYAHGRLFVQPFDPDSVALLTSRGHESPLGKLLMRWTVLSSDALIFFPAAFYFILVYHIRCGEKDSAWWLAMILLNPCLILIDHGHFQYNCISLGLTLAAVAAIFSKNELAASVLFSLALNHKQMSAYFAPAFFGHLLGRCLQRQNPFLEVFKLGFVVLGTFALIWSPFLYSKEAVIQGWMLWFFFGITVKQVLSRLAPFERGIYEDYVANFWCSTSILIKWKRLFTTQSLKLLTSSATLFAFLPSLVQQIRDPSNNGFLYALLNSSFAFYLFSFQVHEKSILLPLLPASLLALEEPLLFSCFTYYALFSMLPLLYRDHLLLPYVALLALFVFTYYAPYRRPKRRADFSVLQKALMTLFLLCSLALHLIYLTLQPPKKYPFLFEALIMIFCFSQFVVITVYANMKQWKLSRHPVQTEKAKKFL